MFELLFYSKVSGYLTVGGFYYKDSKINDLLPVESDAYLFEIVKDMKNGEFLDLYVVPVVNDAEVVEEDVGLANLLTMSEIGENNNVSGGARATNVGDINTDHEVEKDLGETENLEDINLEVDEEFGEASDKVDVDETEQYVEEHLDGVETDVESSSNSEEEGIPEEDDSKVDEELRSVREEKRSKKKSKQQRKKSTAKNEIPLGEAGIARDFEDIGRNKAARYIGRLEGDEDYIDSSEADTDDSKDKLDPEVVVGVDLPGLSSERVVIVGSNIINTAPTNIDIEFKPPGLIWMGREVISTSQLQQMRNSRSENL
ncbi:hypothetical protein HAX54_017155 [Datura stramonium]|uniref:Uncharacterized protein n=1 Tax=Datura stramonium TaxID=4076 RepID=A0ABS8UKY0_DATST|nr:hypothetical protein [Datura stramonium]